MIFGAFFRKVALPVLLVLAVLITGPADALDLSGAILVDYADREGGDQGAGAGSTILDATTEGQFRFTQMNLNMAQDFSDYIRGFMSLSSGGSRITVGQAWMQFDGLPFDGDITAGRFYKPFGAPLQTVGLSYPALLFHTASSVGLKASMERYPWRWEGGVVNANPLDVAGSTLSGSPVFGRPAVPTANNANLNDQNKELYGHLAWQDGGDWGSLGLTSTFTYGHMSRTDVNTLNARGILPGNTLTAASPNIAPDKRNRNVMTFSADYTKGPWRVFGEWGRATEGRLNYVSYNGGISRRFGAFNFITGFDRYSNNIWNKQWARPESWDRKRYTYSVEWEVAPSLKLQAEYEQNREDIAEARDGRSVANEHDGIENDAFILQALATF